MRFIEFVFSSLFAVVAVGAMSDKPDTPRVVGRHSPGVPPFLRTSGHGHS
jgi:hypothetical protein